MYYSRLLEYKVRTLAQHFKVVLVAGARQVGKSTLLAHLYPDLQSYVFDPISDLWQARHDPDLFLQNLKMPAILDEIQYSVEILPGIKRLVDLHNTNGLLFLTGSQNFTVLKHAAESLAGRIALVELKGITIFERYDAKHWLATLLDNHATLFQRFKGSIKPKESVYECILQGALPAAVQLPASVLGSYHSSYVKTYLERDIRLLENVRDLSDFERFLTLLSALTAQELHFAQLGRDIGITPLTAQRWLAALEHGYQWLALPAFSGNAIKRLSQKAKGHFSDTGVACYLLGITGREALSRHPFLGALFESYCVNMIDAVNQSLTNPAKMYHFRTHAGAEVDLIIERDGLYFPIEIKCKTQITVRDVSGIQAFINTYPHLTVPLGIVLHAGTSCYFVQPNILAMPWLSQFYPS